MRGSYSGNTLAFQANADSSILLPRSNTQRWQSGQMHGIANPENREFKSHPLFQF